MTNPDKKILARQAAEAAFITGWKIWVAFGYVAPSDHPDVLAGFQAAEAANERGGSRPTVEDAAEAAVDYWIALALGKQEAKKLAKGTAGAEPKMSLAQLVSERLVRFSLTGGNEMPRPMNLMEAVAAYDEACRVGDKRMVGVTEADLIEAARDEAARMKYRAGL